jgi:hypothetical protein
MVRKSNTARGGAPEPASGLRGSSRRRASRTRGPVHPPLKWNGGAPGLRCGWDITFARVRIPSRLRELADKWLGGPIRMTRKSLGSALLVSSALLGLFNRAKRSSVKKQKGRRSPTPNWRGGSRAATDDVARRFLLYAVMPVWSVAGFLDWLWHKQTKIETTSGVKESVMHLLMMAEAGAPILTGMFLEMNAGALALMGAGWLMHEATVAWDVSYSISRRTIFPREQHTHSYMETIPFDIVVTFACLYPEQFLAMCGLGPEKADFKLRFRKKPIPLKDFAAIVTCMGLVAGLPHLEELWRCYRAQRKGIAGRDIPECARELYAS